MRNSLQQLRELGFRHGRYQSKFRMRHEPKTRRRKHVERGMPWESLFMRKSQAERRSIISKPWEYPMAAQNLSVILIQKRVRGMLCRMHQVTRPSYASFDHGPKNIKATRIRSPIQRFVTSGGSFSDERGFRAFAATKLQSWFRMHRLRWRWILKRYPVYHIAALQIQYAWNVHCRFKLYQRQACMSDLHAVLAPADRAALCIQTAWRSCKQKRIFRYYRDLINFRSIGNPARMLHAINPSEASLLDASIGAQVRFRLGGLKFPPTIYYKIFTHKPVCDVCTFSPKDYTVARQSAPAIHTHSKRRHNQQGQNTCIRVGNSYYRARQQVDDTRLWYRRIENNCWRPVTAKVLADTNADPITQATREQYVNSFHYSKIVRKQDRERDRRYKKRLWMQKLYTQGLIPSADRTEQNEGEDDKAHAENELFDINFDDTNWEDEALDMFEWVSALDYEKYLDNWYTLGCTAATDGH